MRSSFSFWCYYFAPYSSHHTFDGFAAPDLTSSWDDDHHFSHFTFGWLKVPFTVFDTSHHYLHFAAVYDDEHFRRCSIMLRILIIITITIVVTKVSRVHVTHNRTQNHPMILIWFAPVTTSSSCLIISWLLFRRHSHTYLDHFWCFSSLFAGVISSRGV